VEREALERRWLELTRSALPAKAAAEGDWPIRFDHCFMRVCLDTACGGRWYDSVPAGKGPAYKRMPEDVLAKAVEVAENIEAEGVETLVPLNDQSKAWRAKAKER
jgi:hypothetical protein